MKTEVISRAPIPTRLIAKAAEQNSRRALGRIQRHVNDIRVTVTDRRLKPGAVRCQVEIELVGGTTIEARSVSTSPVEAVSKAFDKSSRIVFRRLTQDWKRRHTAVFLQEYALRSKGACNDIHFHQDGV